MHETSIMISIRPEWCKLISEGQKTVEVRKTAPRLELPFKCYIYESRDRKAVVGEFVCDFIRIIKPPYFLNVSGTGLTSYQIKKYAGSSMLYGWHISDLVVYEEPRNISDFFVERSTTYDCPALVRMKRPPQSWCYVFDGKEDCI